MLGEFVINILVLVLGYVYPAVECFKTIETSRTEIIGLRFWCQYWVILAIMIAIEKFGEIFISWLPLYGEFKLAFIVYLWHPRTRGAIYVYETLLRPFMAQHESDIDTRLQFIMSKAVDLLLFYIKNFADKGQSMAFEILQYVLSRSSRSSSTLNAERPGDRRPPPPPSSAPVQPSAPPLQPMPPQHRPVEPYRPVDPYRPVEPYRPTEPSSTPVYPTLDRQEDDMQHQVNRVEEALRAAGVNLRRLRPHQQ